MTPFSPRALDRALNNVCRGCSSTAAVGKLPRYDLTVTCGKSAPDGPDKDTCRKDEEEARNQLPDLLEAAQAGKSTIITRHGRPVAALVPIDEFRAPARQASLMPLAGSGRGMWGKDSTRTIRRLRNEWDR